MFFFAFCVVKCNLQQSTNKTKDEAENTAQVIDLGQNDDIAERVKKTHKKQFLHFFSYYCLKTPKRQNINFTKNKTHKQKRG